MTDEAQQNERTVMCNGCGVVYEKKVIGDKFIEPPERGWYLPYKQFGYYGGFDDEGLWEEGEYWWLCHDCIVKFLDTFPLLAKDVGNHPNGNDEGDEDGTVYPPCCSHAWTWRTKRDEEGNNRVHTTFVSTPEGTWKISSN